MRIDLGVFRLDGKLNVPDWRVRDLEPLAVRYYPDRDPDGLKYGGDPRPCVVCGAEHPWDSLQPVVCPDCKDVPVRPGTRHRRHMGFHEDKKEVRGE